jgi:hypothetical protein
MAKYPDEEIVGILTEGRPELLALTFMCDGEIRTWYPKTGGYLGFLDRNRDRAEACRDYLRRSGRAFDNLDEVRAYGIAKSFPELDKFLESIENWKKVKATK